MERLTPDPGPTSIPDQLGAFRPWEETPAGRPHIVLNFAGTLDGRATIDGRSGPIGSDTDTAMLVGLRERSEAIMIGAGTMRAERYGPLVSSPEKRERRLALGLPADPLMVIIGSLDLPWDADLFTAGRGEVVVFTASTEDIPETPTKVDVIREDDGRVDIATAVAHLHTDRKIRALLCEGGPGLHSQLQAAHLADELFLTIAPKLVGAGTSILEGALPEVAELDLVWLLREGSELFARYRRR